MNCPDETKMLKRKVRALTKALKEHTEIATKVIAAVDREMKLPPSPERGKKLGAIVAALEFSNDSARHFSLGEEFPLSR